TLWECRWFTPTRRSSVCSSASRFAGKTEFSKWSIVPHWPPLPAASLRKSVHDHSFEVAVRQAVRYSPPMDVVTANRLEHVRTEIARACRDAQRDLAGVTLVAVSKTFGPDAIEPVIAAGQLVFGENRVQEAKAKWPPLLSKCSGVELHLIGP